MSGCVKVTYPSEKSAKTALVGIIISNNLGHPFRREPHRERRAYRCPWCHCWHLTSERKNTPGTKTVAVVPFCPECAAAKCRNCDGDSWDNAADDYAPCPCAEAGHHG